MTAAAHRPIGRRPPSDAVRLRPLGQALHLRVVVNQKGLPLQVTSGRRLRRVLQHCEHWRIDDEWWRSPIHRIYHEVVLEPGEPMVLYHDLEEDRWYRQ